MLVDHFVDARGVAGFDGTVGLQHVQGLIGRGDDELVGRTIGIGFGLGSAGRGQADKAREGQALQQGNKGKSHQNSLLYR
ncbi:hypothetical protein D3C87_1615440 [compost metagenome]